ncbi:MAG TPA: LuxR C-terminal-related transcriptional regulator [Gaiellaceae bacterium]|nr:LuxR C-terminal-related transcriptional regulator [Gaiellaceae bacterium]
MAKLLPPALPARLVDRPRLHELLERGTAGLVTLVSAHAGTGKTVLLSSWAAAAEGRAIAWLGLDRDDNWSPRFWLGVERALARVGALDGVRRERADTGSGTSIAERLDGRVDPVVLVLDDFHELESPIVRRELQAVLDRAPSGLRLVISTRADPRLRLQRLRLTDDLTEIRAADLALTLDECSAALAPFAADLTDGDVAALCARTEGWAAGIRLAALSLASEPDRPGFLRRFAGDDRAVADYLLNEILDRQPDRLREFLLRTSVPDTITAELADVLTGRRDGGRVLGELAAANFLVSSHVGAEPRYRYHGLLLAFLRAQLRRTRPHDLELLQRLSARWHWSEQAAIPAFRDALAGGDWELADEISAEAWHLVAWEGAGADVEQRALTQLPPGTLAGRPSLGLLSALASLASGDRQGAEQRLAIVTESAGAAGGRTGEQVLRLQVRAALARLDGDYQLLETVASELAEAPAGGGFDATARTAAQSAFALAHLGAATSARGDPAEAESLLGAALELSRRTGLRGLAATVLSDLALLEGGRGRLRRSVELANEVVEDSEPGGLSVGTPLAGAELALGWAHLLWDDLAAAARHLDRAATAAAAAGDRTGRLAAAALLALVRGAQGPREAAAALVELRGRTRDLDAWQPPQALAPVLETAEARLLVARGDLESAQSALERASARAGESAAIAVLRARLSLAEGAPEDALDALERWPEERLTHLGLRIEALVLTAVARHALHDDHRAGEALEQALALAGPNSHRRPFLDCGSAVQVLLQQRIRWGTAHRSFVGELLAAYRRRAPNVVVTRAALLEPLSGREQSVLRFLPTLMSNAEIAGELFVTSNTVKTHLKSIYRKLGVSRRRDAVERARALELL